MRMSITGLAYSGKTTFFNILTHHGLEEAVSGKRGSNIGTVFIPDFRLDHLSSVYEPKKQINASMEFIDTPGLLLDGSGKSISKENFDETRNADAICLLIHEFDSPLAPHPLGSVDGVRDLKFILNEFIFSDLLTLEKRAEKLRKTTRITKKMDEIRELEVIEKTINSLEKEIPVREVEYNPQDKKLLSSYQLLSAKPILIVLNIGDDRVGNTDSVVKEYAVNFPNLQFTPLCASLEYELPQLDENEAKEFMAEMGIVEPAFEKVIKACFELLGLQVFFTVGRDECRAWPIRRGLTAYEAAGKIHSDIQRGFIRAMVLPYERFKEESNVETFKLKAMQEKKDYLMKDGDIVEYRFNVAK